MAAITPIAASDVPVASRSPKPSHRTRRGTITVPPPTPNRPLNTPAAVPITPSFSQRARGMSGHTRGVSTAVTLGDLLGPVRADPAGSAVLLDVHRPPAPNVPPS